MSQSLGFTGNLRFQPTDLSPPAIVPISINSAFSMRGGFDVSETGVTTNVAIPMGSITSPVLIYIEVYQGTFNVASDVGGTHPFPISVNTTPVPTDKAYFLLYNPAPQALSIWLSTPGAASGRIWIFG